MTAHTYTAEDLARLPTIGLGQCCDLKIREGRRRYWLCRGGLGVSVEVLRAGRWELEVDHQRMNADRNGRAVFR